MEKILFVVGPPGSGKNTQAKFIGDHYGFAEFDMGESIRQALEKGEIDTGGLMEKGIMMPASSVLPLAKRKIEEVTKNNSKGLVITGMPRTLEQAFGKDNEGGIIKWVSEKFLNATIQFINIVISEEEAIKRNMIREDGRVDDSSEIAETRLAEFRNKLLPTLEEVQKRGYEVVNIDGTPSREEVFTEIQKHLEE